MRPEDVEQVALLERFGVMPQYEHVVAKVEHTAVSRIAGRICGDGGFRKTIDTTTGETLEVAGMVGSLGEDMGLILAVAAWYERENIDYEPEELVVAMSGAFIEKTGAFHMHTSTSHPERICDCGHCYLCTQNPEEYGVPQSKAEAMIRRGQAICVTNPNAYNKILDRKHDELSVVVVRGDKTIPHWVTNEDYPDLPENAYGQTFVVDPEEEEKVFREVLTFMGAEVARNADEILAIKRQQDAVTNGKLAKGKPVFEVEFVDKADPSVTFLGMMGEDGKPSLMN